MECKKQFKAFEENISLKATRKDRIDSAISRLSDFIKNDKGNPQEPGLKDLFIELYVQGSYAMGTSIRPSNEQEEFDVDAILCLKLRDEYGRLPNSKEILNWVAKRLKQDGFYNDKTKARNRCIRIDYAGDFHLDIVPAAPVPSRGTVIEIPTKNEDWVESDPKGLSNSLDNKDVSIDRRLKRIIKYLKWWKGAVKPNKEISSVVLTFLLSDHAHLASSDAEVLTLTMESLNDWMTFLFSKPRVPHPTLGCDMAEHWTQEEYDEFKKEFSKATSIAREAFNETEFDKSIKLWQKLFGDQFPRLEEETQGKYVPPTSSGNNRTTRQFG